MIEEGIGREKKEGWSKGRRKRKRKKQRGGKKNIHT